MSTKPRKRCKRTRTIRTANYPPETTATPRLAPIDRAYCGGLLWIWQGM